MSTNPKRLVESTANLWGESVDGIGENRLGELLMSIRNEMPKSGCKCANSLYVWPAIPERVEKSLPRLYTEALMTKELFQLI